MNASSICTDINRLFGDMTRDDAAALKDMRLIADHARGMVSVLAAERGAYEDDEAFDYDEDDDDFDYDEDDEDFIDESDDYDYDDDDDDDFDGEFVDDGYDDAA